MVATQADISLAMSRINLSYSNRSVGVVVKDIAIGAAGFGFDFWSGTGRKLSC